MNLAGIYSIVKELPLKKIWEFLNKGKKDRAERDEALRVNVVNLFKNAYEKHVECLHDHLTSEERFLLANKYKLDTSIALKHSKIEEIFEDNDKRKRLNMNSKFLFISYMEFINGALVLITDSSTNSEGITQSSKEQIAKIRSRYKWICNEWHPYKGTSG